MEPRGSIAQCPECASPLVRTPGGLSCHNGHGGLVDESQLDAATLAGLAWVGDERSYRRGTIVSDKAFPGDTVTFTAGGETFGSFTVGPITVQTCVGPGESASDAFARAVAMAETMFEVAFKTKCLHHRKRAAEVSK